VLKEYFPRTKLFGVLIFAFLVRIYVFSRGKTDATALDIYNIIQIGITFILSGLMVIRKDLRIVLKILFRSPVGAIIYLYILGIISSFWSVLPVFSAYFGFEGLVYLLAIGIVLFNQNSMRQTEKLLITASIGFILLILLGIVKNNGFRINLFTWHTNTYSVIAAMLFSYCLGELSNKNRHVTNIERKLLRQGLLAGLLFVFLGTSSASNIAALSGFVVVVFMSGKPAFKALSVLFLMLVLVLNYFYGDWLFNLIFPGKTISSVEMMSGRITLWSSYMDKILEKPYLGWGFAAFSRVQGLYNVHTHNSIIEIFGGVGIIGLFLFVMYIFKVFSKFIRLLRYPYIQGIISAVTAGLVNSNAISIIGNPTGVLFITFVAWNIFGLYYILEINYLKYNNRQTFEYNLGNTKLSGLPYPGL